MHTPTNVAHKSPGSQKLHTGGSVRNAAPVGSYAGINIASADPGSGLIQRQPGCFPRVRLHCPPRVADDNSLSTISLNSHGCSLSHLLLALSTMVEPFYPLFPIASFSAFVLVLIPLPWHLQAWNSGTCFFILWTSLACLNQFVNSVMWANDALNRAPVWCDICKLWPPFLRFLRIFSHALGLSSHPGHVGRRSWDSRLVPVHHAEATRYRQDPSCLANSRRGVQHFPCPLATYPQIFRNGVELSSMPSFASSSR